MKDLVWDLLEPQTKVCGGEMGAYLDLKPKGDTPAKIYLTLN
jgi:hypothetical protein